MNYRVPTPPVVTVADMNERVRVTERFMKRRGNLNFIAALAVASMAGWTYAQVTRGMGYPPSIIGATAVLFQIAAGICAWAADLGVWLADQWRKSDMPIHFTKDAYKEQLSRTNGLSRNTFWVGFRSGLRSYGPWAIGIATIAFAVFLAWDDMMALVRDAVDIVKGWSK